MKFAYKPDHTVTGYNRAATAGTDEITGTCTPQHWNVTPPEHSTDLTLYTEVGGVPVAKSQTEINAIITDEDRNKAYQSQAAAIETKKRTENEKPFPYDGYTYKSDSSAKNDVEGVLGQCALYVGSVSIPTFPVTGSLTGKWLTEEDVAVPYTCDEFKVFAKGYFDRFSWNFDNRVVHQLMLRAMYDNSAKTAQDILDYDFSEGWQ